MRRRLASLLGLAAVLSAALVWLVGAPVVSAGNPCFHSFEMPQATTAEATTIVLEPCAVTPTLTNVPVGAEVTFKNGSQFAHLITGANQEWGSPEAEVAPGKAVAYTFDKAGVFPYACALHPGMSGVVVVGGAEALTAAAESTSGTTTGTTSTTNTTTIAAPTPTTPASTATDVLPLVVLAAVAGVVIGAAGAWLVGRRRPTVEGSPVTRAA